MTEFVEKAMPNDANRGFKVRMQIVLQNGNVEYFNVVFEMSKHLLT